MDNYSNELEFTLNLHDFLGIGKAAALLGVTENTLRNWSDEGKFTEYRNPINNYRLFKKEDIDGFLLSIIESGRK